MQIMFSVCYTFAALSRGSDQIRSEWIRRVQPATGWLVASQLCGLFAAAFIAFYLIFALKLF